ncbi:MAG: YbaB/EbfC family nucleoid-associated protein [Kiritimatiellae bacterium]|nr:YbaB/EbfC family nucleoid-associated protein [Kiritimatiellia bacterium]
MSLLDGFKKLKEIKEARSQAKAMEKMMQDISAEYSNAGITAIAAGDGSLKSIKITPEAWEDLKKEKLDRFETMLLNVISGASRKARQEFQSTMAKMLMQGGGDMGALSSLFGK